jgi:hypothetical protein
LVSVFDLFFLFEGREDGVAGGASTTGVEETTRAGGGPREPRLDGLALDGVDGVDLELDAAGAALSADNEAGSGFS